ncbi:hypothetical protein AMTR_s00111p00093930 [Amborella trichopoda]|uniref:Uncharacterized protein n=1 Tax=Amborella trichopoda TaxID=13333 RepID=W1NSV5_AMBTC|nr:hypothetical protein AMTR_s00111p00093930 [Amborella trichopoda]
MVFKTLEAIAQDRDIVLSVNHPLGRRETRKGKKADVGEDGEEKGGKMEEVDKRDDQLVEGRGGRGPLRERHGDRKIEPTRERGGAV